MCKLNLSVFLLIFSGFLFISCETPREVEPYTPEYNDVVYEKAAQLLGQNEPERVLHIISSLRNRAERHHIYTEKIKSLEEPAKEKLIEKFNKALNLTHYLDAAEILKSMQAAGIDSEYELDAIYLEYVLKSIKNGEITPALTEFQDRIISGGTGLVFTGEQVEVIYNAAAADRNQAVLNFLLDREVLDETQSLAVNEINAEKMDANAMISGTVTVYVNKGIKLEGGLGYPDIVIGSGFYIDRRGYILTNYHVISSEVDPKYEGFSRLYIKFDENEAKMPAEVIGWDEALDIALLKVEYEPEYIYSFPGEREYVPGEEIYAIGSPGGLDKTLTKGIISASGNRRLLPLGDTIQVDAPINSGNSGGPAIDESGNLVGVVFAGIEMFEGINFIIPAQWIRHCVTELYENGMNRQSWLGLTVHESSSGLEVLYVMPGTSCYEAGISPGDRIISIDGIAVENIEEAQEIILMKKPGTLVRLITEDDEKEYSVLLVLEQRENMPMQKALEIDSKKNLMLPFFGMKVEMGDESFFDQEYFITEVYQGMSADEIGFSVNDPFTLVNWQVNNEQNYVLAGLRIKKRKAGFLKSAIQLGNVIDITNTL